MIVISTHQLSAGKVNWRTVPDFDIFFLQINFDQISFSYGLSTRKET